MRRRSLLQSATFGIFGLSGCAGQLESITGQSESEVKENAKTIDYDELYRNISEYEDEPVYYDRLILTGVLANEDKKDYLISIPGTSGYDAEGVFYVTWDGNPYREDDVVKLWGVVKGLETYSAVGGEYTVPKIEAVDIQRLSQPD